MNLTIKFAIRELRITITANIEIIFHTGPILLFFFAYTIVISSINPYLLYIYCISFCFFIHFSVNLSYE